MEWNLSDKKLYVVTDNATDIQSAFKQVDGMTHIPCVAHTLQLSIKKALLVTEIAALRTKCRAIAAHFRQSSKAKHMLNAHQIAKNETAYTVVQEVETR